MVKKKITAVQMHSKTGDKCANFEKVESLTCGIKTDFLILPEVFSVGWKPDIFEPEDDTMGFLSNLAKKSGANIIGGSYIRQGNFNTCPVFNRSGELIAQYDKMHLFRPDSEEKFVKPGKNPVIAEVEGIKIGLTICYDFRFPEIFRAYSRNGADLLINVAAMGKGKDLAWETLTRARAIENQLPVVALTLCGGQYLGHSRIFDNTGGVLAEITNEGVMSIDIDFSPTKRWDGLNDIQEKYEVEYEKTS